jgi:hypothetical protein
VARRTRTTTYKGKLFERKEFKPVNQALVDAYLDILIRANRQLEAMLSSGQQKRRAIVGDHIDDLNRLIAEEGQYLQEIQRLESRRNQLETALAETWQLSAEQRSALNAVTVTGFLAERAPESLKLFQEIIELIKENMGALQMLNQENQELTFLALSYIDEMQGLLLGEDDAGVYSGEGDVLDAEQRPSFRLLDKKI